VVLGGETPVRRDNPVPGGPTLGVLGCDNVGLHLVDREILDAAEDLHLLVADTVGVHGDRRLHERQGDNLPDVVLDDVAQCAGRFVEAGATGNLFGLGNGYLYSVDIVAVLDRLEDRVREP